MKFTLVLTLFCTIILAFEGCEENPKDSVRYIDSNFNGFEKYEVAEVLINNCASVSYTHLRAHETVLDLVCRLLLEKKKQ